MPVVKMLAAAAAALLLLVAAPAVRAADTASANDTARVLAGLAPDAGSPLAPLTKTAAWQQHARAFDAAFGRLERRQLEKIRAWSKAHLTRQKPTLFYMFSGPDFLYADAFFPNAETYVLSGLEPVGAVPDLADLPRGTLGGELRQLQGSLDSILAYSFFVTKKMKTNLRAGRITGTLPVIYVFLARTGHTVRSVERVALAADGTVRPDDETVRKSGAHGVKIVFSGPDQKPRTLFYFTTDLSDRSVETSGFLAFCRTLAPADGFVKSASYLLHSGSFSTVRKFLLAETATMVQDDSGIPLAHYDAGTWELAPFGRYLGPIALFPGRYQAGYARLFRKSTPIDFGIGYRWRPNQSNVLVATRKTPETRAEK
ncbi:hypothetical protein A33M_3855 [Rhodovulum sp. PH10]|uniref:hypothetical protein n=1 Tax=Rhodovulum sp. PH10 TaxID=1187851 RepID=UPI00027C2722|nr:hypothetical protein [Rhodovulum sp. PH10]EJW13435.1 hypothetical protein A33M_3855 [Rhodovulum sp. PH10]